MSVSVFIINTYIITGGRECRRAEYWEIVAVVVKRFFVIFLASIPDISGTFYHYCRCSRFYVVEFLLLITLVYFPFMLVVLIVVKQKKIVRNCRNLFLISISNLNL